MTTTTVRAAVFDTSSGDPEYLNEVSVTAFAEDGSFDFDYRFSISPFDFRVSFEQFGKDILDLGPDFGADEINVFRLEFGSSFATFLTLTDVETQREYLFELDSAGSRYPGFPTSQGDFQGLLDRLTGAGKVEADSSGVFSIPLSTWPGAVTTENDFLDLSDQDSSETLDFGFGDDTFYAGAGFDFIRGGDGNDRLIATQSATGSVAEAQFFGGAGNDVLKAKGAVVADFIGDGGADKLVGGTLGDTLQGGTGRDVLIGLDGDDNLNGDWQDDTLFGGRDNDTLDGGSGNDKLRGNLGSDLLYGATGDDDLRGGGQNDMLFGQDGNDYLLGENGRDVLSGGAGNDVLIGGYGAGNADNQRDVFMFVPGGGYDSVRDFENGIDKIDLTVFGFTDFENEVLAITTETSAGLKLRFESGTVLYVNDMTLSEFDRSDVYLEDTDIL
jgi:Ca2+-binding RTX toxin-like protein